MLATLVAVALAADPGTPIREAAAALLKATDGSRRAGLLAPKDDPARRGWSYLRGDRPGLFLRDMDTDEREAALALLRASLSAAGDARWNLIRVMEDVNRSRSLTAGRDGEGWGGERYAVRFFGSPEDPDFAWRLEGHHVVVSVDLSGDAIAITPLFWGSYPDAVPEGPRAGERPLGAVQDAGLALRRSLSAEQAAKADLAIAVPGDVFTAPDREAQLDGPSGLGFADLDATQKKSILELLALHLEDLPAPLARDLQERIETEGVARLHFAFAGAPERGQLHYYRLWHPDLVVEFDCTSGDPTHLHRVLHDRSRGPHGDPLREHRAAHPKP
jgi:hypothetical protein